MSGPAEQPLNERALTFPCRGETLVGVLHSPPTGAPQRQRGVVVVVGAPQYRVGSHRQFVLLARALSAAGFPVLRFDYRGMGDSSGEFTGFEGVDQDIRAAVDCLFGATPDLEDAVLWGLCDGASAAAFYAAQDPRVGGLIVLNPWVRTGQTLARARLTSYYIDRLTSREFWSKVFGAKLDLKDSWRDLSGAVTTLTGGKKGPANGAAPAESPAVPVYSAAREGSPDLPDRVGGALRRFKKPTLVILSGDDLVAREFDGTVAGARPMRAWAQRPDVTLRPLPNATHTYPNANWRAQVHAWCVAWLAK
jgi:exosortase A-associated hydrolase 1